MMIWMIRPSLFRANPFLWPWILWRGKIMSRKYNADDIYVIKRLIANPFRSESRKCAIRSLLFSRLKSPLLDNLSSLIRRRSTSLNLIIYRYKYRYSQICLRFSSATSAAPNAREALEEKRNQRVLYSKLESQDDGAGARHALEHVFVPATFLDLSKLTSSSRSWQAFNRLFFPRTLPRFLQPFTMISLLLSGALIIFSSLSIISSILVCVCKKCMEFELFVRREFKLISTNVRVRSTAFFEDMDYKIYVWVSVYV